MMHGVSPQPVSSPRAGSLVSKPSAATEAKPATLFSAEQTLRQAGTNMGGFVAGTAAAAAYGAGVALAPAVLAAVVAGGVASAVVQAAATATPPPAPTPAAPEVPTVPASASKGGWGSFFKKAVWNAVRFPVDLAVRALTSETAMSCLAFGLSMMGYNTPTKVRNLAITMSLATGGTARDVREPRPSFLAQLVMRTLRNKAQQASIEARKCSKRAGELEVLPAPSQTQIEKAGELRARAAGHELRARGLNAVLGGITEVATTRRLDAMILTAAANHMETAAATRAIAAPPQSITARGEEFEAVEASGTDLNVNKMGLWARFSQWLRALFR